MEYKTFQVLYRVAEKTINATKFYCTLDNLQFYGIEKFYNDVQDILETRYTDLCYLKIGELELLNDRCNFTTRPQGKAIKTTKFIRETNEFYYKVDKMKANAKALREKKRVGKHGKI